MHVSALNVYPIKSARGSALDEARLDERGIRFDRRWMLVDGEGVFISQREMPEMALIDVALNSDSMQLRAPGQEPLEVPLQAAGSTLPCRVWRDVVAAQLVSSEADAWFSTFLELSCRLVYMPADSRRIVDRAYVSDERLVGFADAYPLLIIGQGSLDGLNEQLVRNGEAAVPMQRFRPNIVIDGTRPHEEDEWSRIKIGDVTVDVVKPCARCVVTTVDVETGTAGAEPLRTLSRYRKRGSNVLFGQNAVHRTEGTIRVGDDVRVISRG